MKSQIYERVGIFDRVRFKTRKVAIEHLCRKIVEGKGQREM